MFGRPSRHATSVKLILSRTYNQRDAARDSALAHEFLIHRIPQQLLATFSTEASAPICSPACHLIQGEPPCLG